LLSLRFLVLLGSYSFVLPRSLTVPVWSGTDGNAERDGAVEDVDAEVGVVGWVEAVKVD